MGALITYHRTDSNKMKSSEIKKLREFIKKILEKNLFQKRKLYTKKNLSLFNKVTKQ